MCAIGWSWLFVLALLFLVCVALLLLTGVFLGLLVGWVFWCADACCFGWVFGCFVVALLSVFCIWQWIDFWLWFVSYVGVGWLPLILSLLHFVCLCWLLIDCFVVGLMVLGVWICGWLVARFGLDLSSDVLVWDSCFVLWFILLVVIFVDLFALIAGLRLFGWFLEFDFKWKFVVFDFDCAVLMFWCLFTDVWLWVYYCCVQCWVFMDC